MKNNLFLSLFLIIASCTGVEGQESQDTLSLVKSMMENGRYRESLKMMEGYHDAHPGSLYANWIYAQAAAGARKYHVSAELYEQAIRLAPAETGIRIDYARMLAASGHLVQAEKQFDTCATHDPDNPEPWFWLASIRYWRGEYAEALALTDNLILHVPDYSGAIRLKEQIGDERSPWAGLESPFSIDDQPLRLITPTLKGGLHRSNALSADFRLYTPLSTGDSLDFLSVGFSAGNKFNFPSGGVNLYLNLGIFNNSATDDLNWTGEFRVEKSIRKIWKVKAEAWRRPYLYTIASLKRPVYENHFTLAFALDNPDRWNGQVSAEASTFSTDDNYILAYCGWLFAPAVRTGRFDFHFGYGYNYSHARDNMFTAAESLQEILKNWSNDSVVEGIYDPYFTPNKQQVHSLLGIMNFRAGEKATLSLKVNAGVYATTRYPYLYPDVNAQDSLFINRSFAREVYHPLNVTAGVDWQLPRRFNMGIEFSYNSTIYYTTFTGNLSFRKRF